MSHIPLRQSGSSNTTGRRASVGRALLIKPPFFTPWTPPLGIGILKAYAQEAGFSVQCLDLNVDPVLWQSHHEYFSILRTHEGLPRSDGYSTLWWILNAHMLAFANGGSPSTCTRVLQKVAPLYGIAPNAAVIDRLVAVVERFYSRLSERIDELDASSYGVVGTSTYTTSLGPSLFLLRQLKNKNARIRTVMGGGVFADDLAIGSDNLQTLLQYDCVDHAVVGEGEMLFVRLLAGELTDKRLITLDDVQGQTLDMRSVPPPDFSDFDLGSYYHLSIEGARSCPFQCSFCSETIQWGKYRMKPADLLATQVHDLATRCGNNTYFMGDSLMNPYIQKFSAELMNRSETILFDGYLRADKPIADRERTSLLAKAGLFRARLGIESAAPHVLDLMKKMTTPATISSTLRSLSSAGIRPTTYWIAGFPGETQSDFEETLEFIRGHHRHIYELEAHPYYYYPYGQIGSRLYDCRSLYPDDVTEVIKFKAWEPVDVSPSRHERYERLRVMSGLAEQLKIPNIYTMDERYLAEERWQRLHPRAIEVYEGTRLQRSVVAMVESSARASRAEATTTLVHPAAWLLWVTVDRSLQPDTVRAAVASLIENNEVLKLTRTGTRLSLGAVDPGEADRMFVFRGAAGEPAGEAIEPSMLDLTSGLAPVRGASCRIGMTASADRTDVVIAGHPGLFDPSSLALLAEDLFRLCEQLSDGMPRSLLPGARPLDEYEPLLSSREDDPIEAFSAPSSGAVDVAVNLDRFKDDLDECGLSITEVFLGAISCLQQPGQPTAHVLVDGRAIDGAFSRTPGPLSQSRAIQLPVALPLDRVDRWAAEIGQALAEAAELAKTAFATNEDVRWNLQGLCAPPWLGGDHWQLVEFVPYGVRRLTDDTIEVVPAVHASGLRVHYFCRPDPRHRTRAHEAATSLARAITDVMDQCRVYAEAARFWKTNLARVQGWNDALAEAGWRPMAGAPPIEMVHRTASIAGRVPVSSEIDPLEMLVAAYAVVLGRRCGTPRVSIAFAGTHRQLLPISINAAPGMRFVEVMNAVRRRRVEAERFAAGYTAARRMPAACGDHLFFAVREGPDELATTMAAPLELVANAADEAFAWHLRYDSRQFSAEWASEIGAELAAVITEAISTPTGFVVDALRVPRAPEPMLPSAAVDTFSF